MIILITGISSGFGLAMARRLSDDGHIVYGTVRRDVEQLPGVHYLKADVRSETDACAAVKSVVDAEGRIDVLLAMKCLDEGVDIPRTQYGIFASSTGNPRQFIQRRGRILRKHDDKSMAYIYDMIVVPDMAQQSGMTDYFNIEQKLVKQELSRVAYFAQLASNYYTEVKPALDEIVDYFC